MGLNNFIANENKIVRQIEDWFNNQHSKQIILTGPPGNGKTYLIQLLAEKYDYHLQTIDPYDITNKNDFNNIIKTLNLLPIDCQQKKKLVLIENLDEFHKNYRTRLFEMHTVCNYPIVFTGHKMNSYVPVKYRNKIEIFRIKKPAKTKIKFLLKQKIQELNIEMDDEILDKIAEKSPSVRSAINSLYNSSPNEITNPLPTFREQIDNIKHNNLKEDVNLKLLYCIFGNVTDYKTMSILAEFDLLLNSKFKSEIDKYFFNIIDFKFKKDFVYPNFMNQYPKSNNQYKKYCKDMHVSSRIVKREFAKLIELLETKKEPEKQKPIKNNKNNLNSQNIFDFV